MSWMLLSFSVSDHKVPNMPKFKELQCLATNVYKEARGESQEGQVAVARVTLNRVENKHYPKTICGVVYQPYQFSWTKNYRQVVYNFSALNASIIAYNATDDFKATHYHNHTVKPSWRKRLKEGVTINNHTFYYP